MTYLATVSKDGLDARSHTPDDFGERFSTIAGCFSAMITHVAFHAGQAAVIRKSLGRDPLMG